MCVFAHIQNLEISGTSVEGGRGGKRQTNYSIAVTFLLKKARSGWNTCLLLDMHIL